MVPKLRMSSYIAECVKVYLEICLSSMMKFFAKIIYDDKSSFDYLN